MFLAEVLIAFFKTMTAFCVCVLKLGDEWDCVFLYAVDSFIFHWALCLLDYLEMASFSWYEITVRHCLWILSVLTESINFSIGTQWLEILLLRTNLMWRCHLTSLHQLFYGILLFSINFFQLSNIVILPSISISFTLQILQDTLHLWDFSQLWLNLVKFICQMLVEHCELPIFPSHSVHFLFYWSWFTFRMEEALLVHLDTG